MRIFEYGGPMMTPRPTSSTGGSRAWGSTNQNPQNGQTGRPTSWSRTLPSGAKMDEMFEEDLGNSREAVGSAVPPMPGAGDRSPSADRRDRAA